MTVELEFHGGAGTVTGSRHLLTVGETRILIDAGMFQGLKELRLRNWSEPGFDPASVDHVLLTHAHIDHSGYLPRLVRDGYGGLIHCTEGTSALLELMLLDAAKIQEEDADYANRKGYSKHTPALPLYTSTDAAAAIAKRQPTAYDRWLELGDGVRARFLNAGHILGSALIEIEITRDGSRSSIVFSGDVGRYDMPLHPNPVALPACDILICESTYGDRLHDHAPLESQLRGPIRRVVARRGVVVIPSFAVGRAQMVTLILRKLMEAGEIPDVPIHIDSPMAIDATRIYGQHLNIANVDEELVDNTHGRLFPTNVTFHRTVADSKRLSGMPGPRIIISASGMLTGGRVLHHLRDRLSEPENLILLVGYQAAGTRGRALLDGARTLRMHGINVPVEAEVLAIHGLSAHADRDELVRWVKSGPRPPGTVFVTHGEPDAATALAKTLKAEVGARVFTPAQGDRFDLAPMLAGGPQAGGPDIAVPFPDRTTPPRAPRVEPLPASTQKPTADEPLSDERIRRITASPSYARADLDLSLLQQRVMRPVRLQLEYLKPDIVLSEQGVESTIVVFGGTRIVERAAAERQLAAARAALALTPQDIGAARRVQIAERILDKSRFYDIARDLARIVSSTCQLDGRCEFVVTTGGGPGIMEAANRGASDVGAKSVGLNITLPQEQVPNPYITPDLCFQFRYFALRKFHFLLRAKALVAFPGGYGTMDELLQTLTLLQTRAIAPLPVVLVGHEFWRSAFSPEYLVNEGTIAPEDLDLFSYAETAEEAWDQIVRWWKAHGEDVVAAKKD